MLKFWNPESGAIGGLIAGALIALTVLAVFPLIVMAYRWWYSLLGFYL